MISASPTLATVRPMAPVSSCIAAISGILWVLVCGRRPTFHALHCFCISRMLRSIVGRSTYSAGVSRSRASISPLDEIDDLLRFLRDRGDVPREHGGRMGE